MPIHICPHCDSRFVVAKFNTDYVHVCNSKNTALDNEDIPNTSVLVEEYGETLTPTTKNNMLMQGAANAQDGTRASIEGDKSSNDYTDRGNNAKTHRIRQRKQYIDLRDN